MKNNEDESRCDFFYKSTILELATIIGKPIQLKHVLEYSEKHENSWLYILDHWNLKSNLLSEQSEELIKFINEL